MQTEPIIRRCTREGCENAFATRVLEPEYREYFVVCPEAGWLIGISYESGYEGDVDVHVAEECFCCEEHLVEHRADLERKRREEEQRRREADRQREASRRATMAKKAREIRGMTAEEFEEWQRNLAGDYAAQERGK
jgi:hypothetical protein